MGRFTVPPKLQAMGGSILDAIADLLHATPDANTRSAVATGLVFGLWQKMSRNQTPRYPSLLLLREDKQSTDPIDSLVKALATSPSAWEPKVQKCGPFAFGTLELAPLKMRQMVAARTKTGQLTPINQDHIKQIEDTFYAAQQTGFGTGRHRPYSQAWHEEFGLLSDPNEGVILRLESDYDKEQLKQHLHGPMPVLSTARESGANSRYRRNPSPFPAPSVRPNGTPSQQRG